MKACLKSTWYRSKKCETHYSRTFRYKTKLENVSDDKSEALAALLTLGFKQEKIISVLASAQATGTSELIKEALKN